MSKSQLAYSYEVYIAAPPAQVWKGLVDGELTRQYVYGTRFQGRLDPGAPYAFVGEGDFPVVDGTILEVAPEKRLVLTWAAHWDEAAAKDRASRVRYELTAKRPARHQAASRATTTSTARPRPIAARSTAGR